MNRILITSVAAAAIACSTAGGWLAGAGSALAPEPLMLTSTLTGSNGATAAGYYIDTKVDGAAVKWPSTWTYNTSLAAGTPCSTVALSGAYLVTKYIQATGNYRKCV